MRRWRAALVVVFALAVPGVAAAAHGGAFHFDVQPVLPVPEDARLGPDGIVRHTESAPEEPFTTTPDDDPCGLSVRVAVTGKFIVKTFPSGRQRVFVPHVLTEHLTNTANGKSFVADNSGAATFWPEADGDYRFGLFGSSNFGVGEEDQEVTGLAPGAYHIDRGSVLFWIDVEGEGENRTEKLVRFELRTPKLTNICAALR